MRKFWYKYRGDVVALLFTIGSLLAFGFVGHLIGTNSNLEDGPEEGIAIAITVWIFFLVLVARLSMDKRDQDGIYLRRNGSFLDCYLPHAQAGWVLWQAFHSRRSACVGKNHRRYAAAVLTNQETGITELLMGQWDIGKKNPSIIHREAVMVGSEPEEQVYQHITSRLFELKRQAIYLEEEDYLQGTEERILLQNQHNLEQEEVAAQKALIAHNQRMLQQSLS